MKESGRLIQSIQNWIHRLAGLDPLQKKNLSNFFSSSIAFDPKHGHLDLQEAMKGSAQFVQVMMAIVFPIWRAMYMSANFLQARFKCATLGESWLQHL